ncbi:MAG: hypothetical protein P8X50_07875 [Maritimibacter sp.]|jgi:hypothetical protein
MSNDWMIDVLADLKAVARLNGMDATVASLEDACLVALAEISSAHVANQNEKARPAPVETVSSNGKVTPLFSKRSYA